MLALIVLVLLSTIDVQAAITHKPYFSPLSTTDISPDAPFGTQSLNNNGPTPGGRVVGLAWEPPSTLYAATPRAGVWKSGDGGKNWFQSSSGLQFGIAAKYPFANNSDGKTYLAFDGAEARYPKRLLYATIDDDGRVTPQLGGLWVSNDGAQSWQRPDLAGTSCQNLNISTVTFLAIPAVPPIAFIVHLPLVMTDCGIFTTSDGSLLRGWHLLNPQQGSLPFLGGGALLATDAAGNIFACQGSMVWASSDQGGSWVATQAPQLGTGNCVALAADPLNRQNQSRKVLEMTTFAPCPDPKNPPPQQPATCNFEVSRVEFANDGVPSNDQRTLLAFPNDVAPGTGITGPSSGCCGQNVLAAVPRSQSEEQKTDRPGIAYDVFASDRYRFWALSGRGGDGGNPRWQHTDAITPIHGDTWSIAVATPYEPGTRNLCSIWLGNDGGVYVRDGTDDLRNCFPDSGYHLAEHGLHLLTSTSLSGFSVPQLACPSANSCPALYVSSGDNDTWALTPQSSIPGQWGPLGCSLGDSGSTFVTQVVDQVVTGREGPNKLLLLISLHSPPLPGTLGDCSNGAPNIDLTPPGTYSGGNEPPGNAGFAVVGDPSTGTNYYIGVGADGIVSGLTARARSSESSDTGWRVLSAGIFNAGAPNGDQIAAVKAGVAGSTLVIYVLTQYDGGAANDGQRFVGGHVYRGTLALSSVGRNAPVDLKDVSGDPGKTHLGFAAVLFVNPYDPNNLYVFDSGTSTRQNSSSDIKVSFDGGKTWQTSAALGAIATQHGTFKTDCNEVPGVTVGVFDNGCTLRNMYFAPGANIQVAVLQPGGIALSRDHGRHWADLDITHTGVGLQDSINPQPLQIATGAFYDTNLTPGTHHPSLYLALGGAGVHRIDGPLDTLGALDYTIRCPVCTTVVALDDTKHLVINLKAFPDGTFRATQLLDLRAISSLKFHFLIDDNATPQQTISLKNANKTGGVVAISESCDQGKSEKYGKPRCRKRGDD